MDERRSARKSMNGQGSPALSRPRLYLLDVFAERPLEGNQLALVVSDKTLSASFMQRFAAEMNFSETAYVNPLPQPDGSYALRCFTPSHEVAFVGHPIVGAAWALKRLVGVDVGQGLLLALPSGTMPITFEPLDEGGETVWFESPPIQVGRESPVDLLLRALGLPQQDLRLDTPARVVGVGTQANLVQLQSIEALDRIRPDPEAFAALEAQGFPPLIYAFVVGPGERERTFTARFFFQSNGVREDAASGNAAAFLGAYLLEHADRPNTTLHLRIEQGRWLERPSLLRVRASSQMHNTRIHVGGRVALVALGSVC
ncbi:MAG: PhzF family phenazine biosynthesis protein [Betaproteobacteria bacterium]|nr:PhzF family phenazine biosynthesis protein [Betaproteobacteria bacterium]